MNTIAPESRIKVYDDIISIASKVLKINKKHLNLEKNLSELNLSSLSITELVHSINNLYNISISPATFFGHKTIRSFIDFLIKKYESNIMFYYDNIISQTSLQIENRDIIEMEIRHNNLLELLKLRSTTTPGAIAYQFIDEQGVINSCITYEELYKRALAIARKLNQNNEKPKRVLIFFNQGLDFVSAFWGTLFSGALAIPVNFSAEDHSSEQKVKDFHSLTNEVQPDRILTTTGLPGLNRYLVNLPLEYAEKIINIEETGDNTDESMFLPLVTSDTPAYIQYTNGTTGRSKGVIITHGNIIHNSENIKEAFKLSANSRSLSWLPCYHHLGLVIGIIQPVYTGFTGYLSSKSDFAANPVSWLNAISKHKITISGAPNFSYDMCLENITQEDKKVLDLSSWKVAYNCGELITKDTLDNFCQEFKVCGFEKAAINPCYSLSEATSLITVNDKFTLQQPYIFIEPEQLKSGKVEMAGILTEHEVVAVNCGQPFPDTQILIINPENQSVCGDHEVGEIWIRSDSKGSEYLNSPTETKTILQAYPKDKNEGSYLRSGDLGLMYDGCLYVIGKIVHKPVNSTPKELCTGEFSNSYEAFMEAAVIGMAGIFPQSDDCEQYWNNIVDGKNLISEVPSDRWDWQEIYGNPDNKSFQTNIKWGGFINDIKTFDADFFNISPIEALYMDPMQRKLIQVVWHTIENAGYKMKDISGKNVGVFIGIGTFDYLELVQSSENSTHFYAGTGMPHCMAANRISYLFDFKGPSESIDTACSSSLVALNRAVTALKNNECEMAIVGGCNAMLSSGIYVTLSNAGMLSVDGKCKTFDISANGYVRGEGIGAVLLKQKKQAIADKDYIYGVVKGTAVNHGGHTTSLTAPNPVSQSEVIVRAFKQAGITSDTINYIEAHGTGTALGDPIEINGLKMAFEDASNPCNKALGGHKYCGIGSVKTNIGHLEAAAGIAGLIKVLLAMKKKTIPPHIHLNTVNPQINLDESPFYIVGNKPEVWEQLMDSDGKLIPRRAGISSFGFGGVNSHAVLEEYNSNLKNEYTDDNTPRLFVLSAKTKTVLIEYAKHYLNYLIMNKVNLNFKNFNFTLQTGREAMEHRLAIAALNPDELILKLTAFIDREDLFSDNEKNSIYYSHTKGEISGTAFNEEDAEVNRLAEHYYEQKDITNLAKLWISGADIKWQRMYLADENIQRIPLPGYPFRRTEYWISKAKASVTKSKKDNSSDEEFFDYKWVELPLDASASKEEDGQLVQYVLFCDRQGISDRFIELLETKKLKYYRIEWADALKKVGENNYTIDPYNKSDYDYVFIDIHSKSRKSKTYVLNFWPLDYKQLPDYKLSDFDKAIKFTCTTAFNMIQSIISNDQIDNQQVWFLCSNVQPVENQSLNLLPVALWGAAKSIILEQPNILRSIIDIGQLDEYEPQELFNEVNQDTLEGEIVYRNKKRYVSRMVPTEVQPTNELIIAKDGTYLVTGGLGSLGLLTGKWLSEKKAGKILLLSRSGLDMERDDDATLKKIQMINLMKSSGAEVEVLVADVTKKAQLKKVLQKYMDKKELRGIFHTAGVYQSDYVKDMTYLNFDSVIKAKINGTWNLHEITKNYKLDYFVQYSSGVAIWGSASASHYGAANYFLDIYAHYCKMAGLSATSISWGGLWENSNIAANENEEYMKTMGVKVIPSERGMGQLETILRSGETHKVVAPIKWDSFLPVMNFKRKNMLFEYIASSKLRDQGTGDGAFDENDSVSFIKAIAGLPREEMKRVIIESLAHLLKEVLGIGLSEDISSDAGFFALGLDSLTSIDFRNKLEKKLAIEISTTSLFDYNTLELLADYILENYCASANDNLAEVSAVPAADELKPDYLSEEELSKLDEMDNSELLEILKKEMEITN